jgi:hypothetical protein
MAESKHIKIKGTMKTKTDTGAVHVEDVEIEGIAWDPSEAGPEPPPIATPTK